MTNIGKTIYDRRKLIQLGAAGTAGLVIDQRLNAQSAINAPPLQIASDRRGPVAGTFPSYDMREELNPRRLTMAMWDMAYALRHGPGGSFADFNRVLDETIERGYNTVRIDPMLQWIDLTHPERILDFPDPKWKYQPWLWNTAVKGPVGQWIIEFMEALRRRPSLHYTLSAWWSIDGPPAVPTPLRRPKTFLEGAEMWVVLLTEWKKRFSFDNLLYVDIANETPFFFPDFADRIKKETGAPWEAETLSPAQIALVANELNGAFNLLRREFPELRFTTSIHGDLRWLDIPVELDCLDVHFYADADPRWTKRTRFDEIVAASGFYKDGGFADLSNRANRTAKAIAPMLHARQRSKMAAFSEWSARRGAPLTCSEGWSAWYWLDHPDLDWGWLLDWSKWTLDDAIATRFWGWTPHNYVQPQFANWRDVQWHRTLNDRFLKS